VTTTASRTGRLATRRSSKPAGVAVPHLSVAEGVARGKAARVQAPRATRAASELSPTRADPIELPEFSKAYAEQNERDYRRLTAAVDAGELVARTGL
jgi:hypothetical protein